MIGSRHDWRRYLEPNTAAGRGLTRRACLTGGTAMLVRANPGFSAGAEVRLGILQFGTVQWVSDVIKRHGLDLSNGVTLRTAMLADTGAGRVALMAKATDIVVTDWMFVAAHRAVGTKLCFVPFTSSTGGIMVQEASPIRSLADLKHSRIGVAGGPMDKSWLIARAATKAIAGFDLADDADVVYAAPPLLNAKLMQRELDALVTYWNFAARLETLGCREVISIEDCGRNLGLPAGMSLLGFVFHEDWANDNPQAINGFLSAVAAAENVLTHSVDEWSQVRSVMNASDDRLFEALRRRFLGGISHLPIQAQVAAAERLFDVLSRTAGNRGTDGVQQLPQGVFWPGPNG